MINKIKENIEKLILKIYVNLFKEKNSNIYCHKSGNFYAVYYSDLKKWVIEDGDYCQLKQLSTKQ